MNARETSTVEYISLQTFYFNLNILKFELEYERTPPQIFLAFFSDMAFYIYFVTM